MTEDKKQELAQLLHESLSNLEIRTTQGKANNYQVPLTINLSNYRLILQNCWIYHLTDVYSSHITIYELHITNDTTKSKFLDFIRQEFSSFIHEDHIQSASTIIKGGIWGKGYPLDWLLKQILKIAIAFSIKKAVSDFEKCTKNTSVSFQYMAILDGIRVEEEMEVFDHMKLVPTSNDMSAIPRHIRTGHPLIPETYFQSKTLLVIDDSISPIFFKHSELEEISQKKNHNFSIDNFYHEFCRALSLVCNFAVQPTISWTFLEPYEICNLMEGFEGSRIYRDSLWLGTNIVEKAQIDQAKDLYKVLDKQDPNLKNKLQIPINRWLKSKTSRTNIDKIIDLGIAFESLYLSDRGANSELSFQFRLRASWYLGKDKADREMLMDEFKAIYTLRSKAVHTGKIPQTVKIRSKSVPISEFIPKSQDLCRQSIMKIIEKRVFPDLNNEILGCE